MHYLTDVAAGLAGVNSSNAFIELPRYEWDVRQEGGEVHATQLGLPKGDMDSSDTGIQVIVLPVPMSVSFQDYPGIPLAFLQAMSDTETLDQ